MFNPRAYENSRPDGIGVLEVVGGDGEREEGQRRFVPLRRTELRGDLLGPLAALRIIQVYSYSRQQSDKVLEAVYRFPLPGDAAVSGVRVRFGDVEIRAMLQERQQAEEQYSEAKRQGWQAALLTRESPDVFTLHVAGIQPDQEIAVETSYVQLARTEGTNWTIRIPLTTAPRYVRGDELGSRHSAGQPLLVMRDPGHRFSLDLVAHGAGEVRSPTHRLDIRREGQRLHIQLAEGEVIPDRDCVLAWAQAQEQDRPALSVLHYEDRDAGYVYFLALAAPPAVLDQTRGIPRDVILLVDHSGSMLGAKWEAADWAVKQFLAGLTQQDCFNLGLFHNTTRWFSGRLRPADPAAIDKARAFLERYRDNGGTELGVALEQALNMKRKPGERARHVLIVTDAEVTDAARILRLADQERERNERQRISVLCIDAAPNAFLVHELAERGGGSAKFLTSAAEEEDIATALDEVLTEWGEPVLVGLRLEVNRPEIQAAGRQVQPIERSGWSAIDLGDLPAGRSLWVAGRVRRGESANLSFRLATARGHEIATYSLSADESAGEWPAIKMLFGARQILGLEYLMHGGYPDDELRDQLRRLGYDPEQLFAGSQSSPPTIYAENARSQAQAALRDLLVREALNYGLASAETAFVAVRSEAGRPIEGTVPVANALPAGWSDHFLNPSGYGILASGMAAPAGAPPPPPTLLAMHSPQLDPAAASPSNMRSRTGGISNFFKKGAPVSAGAPQPAAGRGPTSMEVRLFAGVPDLHNGEAVLFDSSQDSGSLPEQATISRLTIRFPSGAPANLDPDLTLLLFAGDLIEPRARVRLADLVRQGGARPLNVLKQQGQVVRITLRDPAGAWAQSAPALEIVLEWR